MFGKLKKIYHDCALWYNHVLHDEYRHMAPVSKRFMLARKGFSGKAYHLFELDHNNIDDYISEIGRQRSREINGDYKLILDDKFLFTLLFGPYIRVPKIFARVAGGRLTPMNSSGFTTEAVLDRIREEGSIIIKPIGFGGGKDVSLIKCENGRFIINGREKTESELLDVISSYRTGIITEVIKQSDYGNSLYPGSVNTVRVITARKQGEDEFRVYLALQRIGSDKTAPVDNFKSGGLAAPIDLDTGLLGKALSSIMIANGSPMRCDTHPDTGGQISGVLVPGWEELKQTVVNASNAFPFLRLIAWDIAICPDGICAIEANASAGLNSPQALFGGQRNTPLGDVYKSYGIIR